MPEGHTIHRIARDHTALLAGRPVEVGSPQGRFTDAALVDGHRLERIEAYGKHLFYRWDHDLLTHVHLGLIGKFRVHVGDDPPPPAGEVRMRMRADGAAVDLSGPIVCEVVAEARRDDVVATLGPDPLRRDGQAADAIARMQRKRQPIGQVLLDQSVVAGIGNVYRAEMLFVQGIHPARPAASCTPEELGALWETARSMLRKGVRDNRIVTIDRRLVPAGRRLQRGDTTFVYHRVHCLRCGTAILTLALGGRPCYFCPACQPS